jgi:DNA primase
MIGKNAFQAKEAMMKSLLYVAVLLASTPVVALAQVPMAAEAGDWTNQQKRAWLYEKLVAPVQNARLVQAYTAKLAAMNGGQLDQTIASYQQQLAYRNRLLQQQWQQQQLQQQWNQLQNRQRLMQPNGFRPIVTWLPTGTNFSASAVVSPDRRHVRMSLAPFFSSIPRVDTFNYSTGQYRNIYTSNPQPTRSTESSRVRPEHQWYKKIRTLR